MSLLLIPRVAPQPRWRQATAIFIGKDFAVHLPGDANGENFHVALEFIPELLHGILQCLDPIHGVLFVTFRCQSGQHFVRALTDLQDIKFFIGENYRKTLCASVDAQISASRHVRSTIICRDRFLFD